MRVLKVTLDDEVWSLTEKLENEIGMEAGEYIGAVWSAAYFEEKRKKIPEKELIKWV